MLRYLRNEIRLLTHPLTDYFDPLCSNLKWKRENAGGEKSGEGSSRWVFIASGCHIFKVQLNGIAPYLLLTVGKCKSLSCDNRSPLVSSITRGYWALTLWLQTLR